MAKKTKPERKAFKPVSAPINAPQVNRGDPNIGKKRQKAARSQAVGKGLMLKGC